MGSRYIISGCELGMLIAIDNLNARQKIAGKIMEQGYIGDKESPQFKEIKKILAKY